MSYYENGTLPPIGAPKLTYAFATVPARPEPSVQAHVPAKFDPPTPVAVPVKVEVLPPDVSPVHGDADVKMIEHPLIKGRFTVFVLCYGDHVDLARKCIESIRNTLPAHRLDLRVGMNAVSDATREYVKSTNPTKIYDHPENIHKYPLMREMFHDQACPIETPYIVWFDDDTQVIDQSMWAQLVAAIVNNHAQGCRLYGWQMVCNLQQFVKPGHSPYEWFRKATWWKGKSLWLQHQQREAPNGTVVQFVPGWFWSMATEMIIKADIPDIRLDHNGGDATIGEQIHQQGWRIKNFNTQKSLVWCPPKENGGRRGFSQPFPFSAEAARKRS